MRILTFTSLFPNSIDPTHGVFILQRASHVGKRPGIEVQVMAPMPFFPRWLRTKRWRSVAQPARQEEIDGMRVYHPRYFMVPKISMRWQGISVFLRCLPQVWALNRHWKIDCIDAHYLYPDGFAAVLLGRVLDIPVVVSARGSDVNLLPKFSLVRGMIRWTLRKAAAVVAVSDALRRAMEALGAEEGKIQVIPNGVDVARFQPEPPVEARGKLGVAEAGPMIVSIGNLIPSKGHELLIQAMGRLMGRHDGLSLYIIGEGSHRGSLEHLIAKLKLTGRVFLMGKRPNHELMDWYNAAAVSCLVSAREGWPNVVTESLACGTPVVATNVGGIPEIIHSEDLGILVEQSVDSVERGLDQALAKRWNRAEIARQARRRTWDNVAEELDCLFTAQISPDRARERQATKIDKEPPV